MATQYPSNRSSDGYSRSASSTQPGISRANRGGYAGRPAGQRPATSGARRPASGQRPSGQRSAPRPTGQRPVNQRPPQRNGNRRPPQRRRKPMGRFYAFIAVVAVLLVAVILLVTRPGRQPDVPVNNVVTPTQAPEVVASNGFIDETNPQDETETQTQYSNISDMLSATGNQVEGLSADKMVKVEGLSIKEGLPSEWINVLLLGTDERILSESGRTDAMMICSINTSTGEVKLTSIMRDLAVTFKDIGEFNGTYGINAANYFGGPKLAMRTVNELFDMNIQNYVMVNFFGFGKIAQRLGGVEVDITEDEMKIINKDIVSQFKMAYKEGITDFDPEQVKLETYGPNTHLNGNQTLAYARIRHLDGGDYMRTTRQQTVLSKLLEKAKKLSAIDLAVLGAEMLPMVKTNMDLDYILKVAGVVMGNGISNLETFRLPVNGTYKEEVRKEKSLLWDCDYATNAVKLYDFIFE